MSKEKSLATGTSKKIQKWIINPSIKEILGIQFSIDLCSKILDFLRLRLKAAKSLQKTIDRLYDAEIFIQKFY